MLYLDLISECIIKTEIMIKLLIQLVAVLVICGLFFGLTDPGRLPVGFLMVPIILIFVLFYLIARVTLRFATSGIISGRNQKTYAVLSGLVAAMIMLFQSTGGIVWADIILMTLLIIIAYFYINKL